MKKINFLIFLFCLPFFVYPQQGKDGAGLISAANTVINTYTYLTTDVAAGVSTFSVGNTAAFSQGDLVMIIQMQGATIANVADSTWGAITNYNSSGFNEFHEIASVDAAINSITFSCPLEQSYTASGKVQVIKVPRYTSLTIQPGASIVASPWNGTAGGIVAAEVSGNVTINGSINVSGQGFRGGQLDDVALTLKTFYAAGSGLDGAEKGEGIAGYQADYDAYGGRFCRGAPANGGGGGNAHNAAGGGGSNAGMDPYTGNGNPDNSNVSWSFAWNLEYSGFANSISSGGGRGGYSYGSNNANALISGPGNNAWGADLRRNVGGKGGRPLDYSTGRLFLGGGGGAGDANNTCGGAGGSGGGLVYLKVCGSISGTGTIVANGNQGQDSPAGTSGNDAVGGGGGGGTVILNANGGVSGVAITANGGKGGNQVVTLQESEGPGGGGGGGYIAISGGNPSRSALGGGNGTTNSSHVTEFIPNGATKGGAGISNATIVSPNYSIVVKNDTICIGESSTLTATLQGTIPPNAIVKWYKANSLSSYLSSGLTFSTGPITKDTTIYVSTCPYNCSAKLTPVYIKVSQKPVPDAGRDTTVCSGASVQLGKASVANHKYSWSPATNLSSANVSNPVFKQTNSTSNSIVTTYILTESNYGCTATDNVTVTVNPQPIADAGTDKTVCSNIPATIGTAAVAGYSYKWTPATDLDNAAISAPTLKKINTAAALSTTYKVVVEILGCKDSNDVSVTVNPYPVPVAGPDISICSNVKAQLGTATKPNHSYAWTPATNLDKTNVSDPVFQKANATASAIPTTYILTETALGCTATDTVKVTVNPYPVADAGGDASVCSNVSVLAGVASKAGYTYSWSPTAGLSNPNVSNPSFQKVNTGAPLATTYTLVVESLGCRDTDEVILTVNPFPVPDAGADATVCSGTKVKLGKAEIIGHVYSWSPATNLDSPAKSDPVFQKNNLTAAATTHTFTLTETANNCAATDQVTITVKPNPIAAAGTDGSVCSNIPFQLGSANNPAYTYSWSPVAGLSNAAISNPVFQRVTGTTSQINIIELVADLAGCKDTDTVVVVVNPYPIADAGVDDTICSDIQITLGKVAASPNYNYSWSPSTYLDLGTKANPVYKRQNLNASAIVDTLILTAATVGCSSKDTVIVTVNPYPKADAGLDSSVCSNVAIGRGTITTAGYKYEWNPITGLSNPNVSDPVLQMANTTANPIVLTHSVKVTFNNCSTTDQVVTTINPYPVADAGPDVDVCPKESVKLGVASIFGNTYSWAPSSQLDNSSISNPTFVMDNTTQSPIVNNLTLTVTSKKCVSTDNVKVTVNPNPIAEAGNDTVVCPDVKFKLGTAKTIGYTYSWNTVLQLDDSASSNPVYTSVNNGNSALLQKYYVTVTSLKCISKDSIAITINPYPVVDAGPKDTICPGEQINLGTTSTPGYIYTWTANTGLSPLNSSSPTVKGINASNAPVLYKYALEVSSKGCIKRDTSFITVDPLPKADAGVGTTVCSNVPVQLGSANTPNYIYTWSGAGGLSSNTISNPSVKLINSTNLVKPFQYYLIVNYYSCADSDTVVVNINPSPIADAGRDTSACSGNPIHLGTPSVAGYTYDWNPPLPGGKIAEEDVTLTNTGTLPDKLTYILITTYTTCKDTDTVSVTINPYPIANAGSSIETCSGVSKILNGTTGTNYSYLWQPAFNLTKDNIPNPVFNALNLTSTAQSYLYKLSVTLFGCTNEDTMTVQVYPFPKVSPGTDTTVCYEATRQLGMAPASGISYKWAPIDFLSSSIISNPILHIKNEGTSPQTFTYTLTADNGHNCISDSSVSIKVYPNIKTSVSPIEPVCKNEEITIEASGGVTYLWNTGDTTSVIKMMFDRSRTLYVYMEDVCKGRDSVKVIVKNDDTHGGIFIPSAFSPDDNSLNDEFEIKGTFIKDLKMSIFNRWGESIYQSTSLADKWDGKLNGEVVQQGVYVYIVETKSECNEMRRYHGTVTVIK